MKEFLTQYGSQYIEFRAWGWNASTIGFVGTLALTLIQGYGQWAQIKTILRACSGRSIPMFMNAYFVVYSIAFGIYGVQIGSLAMMVNSLLGGLFFVTYVVAGSFRGGAGYRKKHWLSLAVIPFMFMVPKPELIMNSMMLICCLVMTEAPVRIILSRSTGSVNPLAAGTIGISCLFWAIYAGSIGKWFLCGSSAFGVVGIAVTLIVWWIYKPMEPTMSPHHYRPTR